MPGSFWSHQPCPPRSCLPTPICGPIAPTKLWRLRRTPGCATTSGCSAASSATPCATRKAPTSSIWSSASGRPRSASTATTTGRRGASSKPSSTACRSSETVRIVRAFSYFSHLANIAEDQHHIRQMRARTRSPASAPRAGHAGPDAVARAGGRHRARADLRAFFAGALVSPVLTAHPTEVQRKSTHRPRDGDRRAARRARPHPADAGGSRGAATSSCAAPC